MVRAKFICVETGEVAYGSQKTARIKLMPVHDTYDDSEENKKFFEAATPSGQIELSVVNVEAAKQFEVGKRLLC